MGGAAGHRIQENNLRMAFPGGFLRNFGSRPSAGRSGKAKQGVWPRRLQPHFCRIGPFSVLAYRMDALKRLTDSAEPVMLRSSGRAVCAQLFRLLATANAALTRGGNCCWNHRAEVCS